jgi:adenine-specific DNA-methyltransferase
MATASSKTTSVPSQRQPQFAHLETRFVELMTELFQLDEAEALDFGLYRIIRRHNREVRAFLGEIVVDKETRTLRGGRLAELLDTAFASIDHEAQAGDKLHLKELEKDLGLKPGMTQQQREALLVQAEGIPAAKGLVAEYRSCAETLGLQQTVQQDRAEVLNRLYQFFSRHYQDGDFIVERRYGKGGARYVKSTGEDTEFHWATEDMYYIKSGDIFTDFPVRLANGQRLLFTVEPESLQATRSALKPNDKAHYELDAATKEGEVIKLSLKYLKGAQTEKQKDEIVTAAQKVGAGGTAENAADIRRWLGRFMARNQSDFFIHKRLKEALSDDLDIFLKTDVLDVDQLLAGAMQQDRSAQASHESGPHRARHRRPHHRVPRRTGRIPESAVGKEKARLRDPLRHYPRPPGAPLPGMAGEKYRPHRQAAAQGMERTGAGRLYAKAAACIRKIPGDLATAASEHYLPLPVDTRNFDAAFKWSLLDAVTAATPLDDALDGVAINPITGRR